MKTLYRYAIIRFSPFAETEEFANIGVIAVDVAHGQIGYQIAPKRFSRIRHFFDEQGYAAYAGAVALLELELGRISEFLPSYGSWDGEQAFNEIVTRRESSIRFSEPRVAQADPPLSHFVAQLYGRFVKRDFSTDTPEVALTRDIRKALKRRHLGFFKQIEIDDEVVSVRFPLAHRGDRLRAIRPLSFGHKRPMAIVDYAAHWRKRLEYLLDRNQITPRDILIATQGPTPDAESAAHHAYRLAKEELGDLPFDVVPGEVDGDINERIIAFARDSIGPTRLTF
ncbi:DUF3037 domain-containing protein [Sphingomonas sp.]|uniref:DUF3037 domain-containing protein n=1 Tax=Sphingomonas sp. TaxID=28214 RepID=UPI0031CF6C4A